MAWTWLGLPASERDALLADATPSESAARLFYQGLALVRRRLWREAGFDPDDLPALQALLERVRAGHAAQAESAVVQRTDSAGAMSAAVAARHPAVTRDPDTDALASLNAHTEILSQAIQATGIGQATPASIDALRIATDEFALIRPTLTPAIAHEHDWWMGLAWWAVGSATAGLNRHLEAIDAFERSATFYDAYGDSKSASGCRQRVSDLRAHLAADVDVVVSREVEKILAAQTPIEHVQSLTRVLREVGSTGDRFEAARLGDEAAAALATMGYPDPEPDFDAAIERWTWTAASELRGTDLFARLCLVTEQWAAVLGARANGRRAEDPTGSERAERALRGLGALSGELDREARAATAEAAARFAVWFPQAHELLPTSAPDLTTPLLDTLARLDDELYRLRVACNEGASDAQVTQAAALAERAALVPSRVHVARAWLEQAYVLAALGRHDEVAPAADRALSALVADKAPSLGAFATAYERELYLTAIIAKARALAARRNHAAILALAEPVIRDIEVERARVSSPYQQSAFLATRAELYELVAVAALRRRRTGLLLEMTELLKARGTLRRMTARQPDGDAATRDSEYDAELAKVSDALRHATPGTDDDTRLRAERRWLSTSRAIAAGRRAGTLPHLSVAAVQRALEAREAAVSWFWVGTEALIVLAFTRSAVTTAVVQLDATARDHLREYLEIVRGLGEGTRDYAVSAGRARVLIAALGPILLPQAIRIRLARAERLVLCPHRSLHLFPFHAVGWGRGRKTTPLIARFVVRYVPNLTSLLMPWAGVSSGSVLAVGVSSFDDPALPRLPSVEAEVVSAAAIHKRKGQAVLAPTRASFTALPWSSCRCLHLSTHGSSVLCGDALDDPMSASLFLRDGPLTGWDLSTLPLRAELVVMAACHSGQRSIAGRGLERLPGDDILGLQSVFFDLGVGAVLGALWPVRDDTTRDLLLAFHRAYARGAQPGDALAAAMRTLMRRSRGSSDVFGWEPFFVSAFGRAITASPSSRARIQSRHVGRNRP